MARETEVCRENNVCSLAAQNLEHFSLGEIPRQEEYRPLFLLQEPE
jgi:hypothetical protein